METTRHSLTILSPLEELDRREWGTISFSRQVLALSLFNLEPKKKEVRAKLKEFKTRFGRKYDFFTFAFTLTVNPGEDLIGREFAVNHIEIRGTINPTVEEIEQRPYVLSTGPESTFADGEWKIVAGLDIGFDVTSLMPKFIPIKAEVNFDPRFKWQQRKIKVVSGPGDGFKDFFWRFEKTKSDWPVGANECVMIVKKPKSFPENIELELEGDLEFVDRFPGWHRIRVPIPRSTIEVLES